MRSGCRRLHFGHGHAAFTALGAFGTGDGRMHGTFIKRCGLGHRHSTIRALGILGTHCIGVHGTGVHGRGHRRAAFRTLCILGALGIGVHGTTVHGGACGSDLLGGHECHSAFAAFIAVLARYFRVHGATVNGISGRCGGSRVRMIMLRYCARHPRAHGEQYERERCSEERG